MVMFIMIILSLKRYIVPCLIIVPSFTFPTIAAENYFSDSLTFLDHNKWWKSNGWSNGFPFMNSWESEAIVFGSNGMTISITNSNFPDTGYPYQSGELRSHQYYGYGCYEVDIRPVSNSGVITSFFLFAGPYDVAPDGNGKHNEIDFEFLGNDTSIVQLNYWTNDDRYENAHEHIVDLGFDASQDFHRYGIEWSRDAIKWYVDGYEVFQVKNVDEDPIPTVGDSHLRVMFNSWVTDTLIADWAGVFTLTEQLENAKYRNFSYKELGMCGEF